MSEDDIGEGERAIQRKTVEALNTTKALLYLARLREARKKTKKKTRPDAAAPGSGPRPPGRGPGDVLARRGPRHPALWDGQPWTFRSPPRPIDPRRPSPPVPARRSRQPAARDYTELKTRLVRDWPDHAATVTGCRGWRGLADRLTRLQRGGLDPVAVMQTLDVDWGTHPAPATAASELIDHHMNDALRRHHQHRHSAREHPDRAWSTAASFPTSTAHRTADPHRARRLPQRSRRLAIEAGPRPLER